MIWQTLIGSSSSHLHFTWKWELVKRVPYHSSCVQLSVTPWTGAHQAALSLGFSRKEHGLGCHLFLQGIFPTQGANLHLLQVSCNGRKVLYH